MQADTTRPMMNTEVFGVFGDSEHFHRHALAESFNYMVSGPGVTVGIRDWSIGLEGRSSIFEASDACCVVWGELLTPSGVSTPSARWVHERYRDEGFDALSELNGSYVIVMATEEETMVFGDLLRSRECFYTDIDGVRVFGTDAARVAITIPEPQVDTGALNHFLHCGVVFEERTLLEGMYRMPFDGYVSGDSHGSLDRIQYDPGGRSADAYATDLASRLQRAVKRRSIYPPRRGILASAGFDSRLLIGTVADLDVSYTIGRMSTPEVRVARQIAEQYGISHTLLPVSGAYLTCSPEIIQYTNGVRESIHIHHRGNLEDINVSTIYHGLLLDTVLRDIYLPTRSVDLFGHALPLPGLDLDPDPFAFMTDRLGIYTDSDALLGRMPEGEGAHVTPFLERVVADALEECLPAADSIYNQMAMLGLKVTQALPFKTHLADNYNESLLAADTELIDWHLTTPPVHRNKRTFQRALDGVDEDLLRFRPPDRPYRSHMLNEIEGFLRRQLPLINSPGTPWPDRREIYMQNDMDRKLFPDTPVLYDLPTRIKLRIYDALTWLELATGRSYQPVDLLALEELQ